MAVNTLYIDGDNAQLRRVIFSVTPKAIEQTKNIAQQFKGKTELETCRNIFNYLKGRVQYLADGHHQKVKLPSALMREKIGDCKSYSVFTYAILTNLGIPCKYVLTSYNNDPTPTHIYVVTNSGIIIDAVWGKFNSEKKPTYKYIKDMRISTITGISRDVNAKVQIGCASCSDKRIGDDTIPSYHKGDWKGSFDSGLDWYRVRRHQDKGAPKLSTGSEAEWYLKKTANSLFRGAFLQFIRSNGGGIATSMYNNVFRVNPKVSAIPIAETNKLNADLSSYAQKLGLKVPTESQLQKVRDLAGVVCSPKYEGKGLNRKYVGTECTSKMPFDSAFDRVMGGGQYKKFADYTTYKNKKEAELKARYTIPVASQKSKDEYYNGFQVKWFWLGGNPEDLTEAIIEGNQKSPRGRDANYMMMVAKTRGLKAKDIGLIIRGFVSAFAGDRFDWGAKDTYIFGTKSKIGLTGAEVSAWVGANLGTLVTLFGILRSIWVSYKAEDEAKGIQREIDKLLTDGWILEEDYLGFNMPRPKVLQVKQFVIPKAEFDAMAIINVGAEILSNTSKGQEIKKEATQDKNTSEFLNQIVNYGQKVAPKEGEKVVMLVKIDPNSVDGDTDKAGFGNAVLPILIGVGVLMALNKGKKLQNG